MLIDLSMFPIPPLKFLLQNSYTPTGVFDTFYEGRSVSYTPWYSELAFKLTGGDASVVLYVLPKDDDTNLLIACLDEAPEPLFRLISGADFGDELVALMAKQWPDVHQMLKSSQDASTNSRILCNIRTQSKVQWAVSDSLCGPLMEEVTSKQAWDLTVSSLRTMIRFTDPGKLQGLLQVLGGPDQTARRLKALSGLLNATTDIGSNLSGGVDPDKLLDVSKAMLEFVKNLRDMVE